MRAFGFVGAGIEPIGDGFMQYRGLEQDTGRSDLSDYRLA